MGPEEIALGIKGDLQRLARSIREIVTPNRVFGVPEQIIAAAFVTNLAPSPSSVLEKASDLGIGNVFCAVLAIILGLVSGILSPRQWQSLIGGIVNGIEWFVEHVHWPKETSRLKGDTVQERQKQASRTAPQTTENTSLPKAAIEQPVVEKGKGRTDPDPPTNEVAKPRRSLTDEEKAAILNRRLAEKREMALRAKTEATGVGPSFARPVEENPSAGQQHGELSTQSNSGTSSRDPVMSQQHGSTTLADDGEDREANDIRKKEAAGQLANAQSLGHPSFSVGSDSTLSNATEIPKKRAEETTEERKRSSLARAAASEDGTKADSDELEDPEARKKRKEEALRLYLLDKAMRMKSAIGKTTKSGSPGSQEEDAEARRKRKEKQLAAYTLDKAAKTQAAAAMKSHEDLPSKPLERAPLTRPVVKMEKPSKADSLEAVPTDAPSTTAGSEDSGERGKRKEEAYTLHKLAKAEEARRAGAKGSPPSDHTGDTASAENTEARAKRKTEELRQYLVETVRRKQDTETSQPAQSKIASPARLSDDEQSSSTHQEDAADKEVKRSDVTKTPNSEVEDSSREPSKSDTTKALDRFAASAAQGQGEGVSTASHKALRTTTKPETRSQATQEHLLRKEVKRPPAADSLTQPDKRSELPYDQDLLPRELKQQSFSGAEDLKAKQRVKELAMRQNMADKEKLRAAAENAPDGPLASGLDLEAGLKPLKSALKKPNVTFAGLPEIPANQAPNHFLTKCGPARPALVPFPHGLHPKAGKPPGTLWFNNIPDDASQLMAPTIRSRKKSAA